MPLHKIAECVLSIKLQVLSINLQRGLVKAMGANISMQIMAHAQFPAD